MYVRNLYMENSGPIERLGLEFPIIDGKPKPIVVVGGNGSGKTNLMSTIADALFEAAAKHYQNVLQGQTPFQRPWFRIVGGKTIRQGATGAVSIVNFVHGDKTYVYLEKGGTLSSADVQSRAPESLKPHAQWPTDGEPLKSFNIEPETSRQIFQDGAYAYFPASRAETPHWLNREAIPATAFDSASRMTGVLQKPLFVDRGLERFEQWLAAAILDSRADITVGSNGLNVVGNVMRSLGSKTALALANSILQHILGSSSVRFAWQGRYAAEKIGVYSGDTAIIRSLDGLSSGQSTLLSVFGTIIRYGDVPSPNAAMTASAMMGICVVDEIDAHMHVDLQMRSVPQLIKMFPSVQFIVSAHSPLFVLGMEKIFGADGFSIIEMPSGVNIRAQSYREFESAFRALQDTKAFEDEVERAAGLSDKAIVFLEGDADQEYFLAAVDILGFDQLLKHVEFIWIGSIDPKTKNNLGSGKDGLTAAYNFLKSNPQICRRRIVFLYDVDVAKTDIDEPPLHIRTLPRNPSARSSRGIENMFDAEFIPDEVYFGEPVKRYKDDGGSTVIISPNKDAIREYLCKTTRSPAFFVHFRTVLEGIETLVNPKSPSAAT